MHPYIILLFCYISLNKHFLFGSLFFSSVILLLIGIHIRGLKTKSGKVHPVMLLATFLFSAIWHGFYPGYYFFFSFLFLTSFGEKTLLSAIKDLSSLKKEKKQQEQQNDKNTANAPSEKPKRKPRLLYGMREEEAAEIKKQIKEWEKKEQEANPQNNSLSHTLLHAFLSFYNWLSTQQLVNYNSLAFYVCNIVLYFLLFI